MCTGAAAAAGRIEEAKRAGKSVTLGQLSASLIRAAHARHALFLTLYQHTHTLPSISCQANKAKPCCIISRPREEEEEKTKGKKRDFLSSFVRAPFLFSKRVAVPITHTHTHYFQNRTFLSLFIERNGHKLRGTCIPIPQDKIHTFVPCKRIFFSFFLEEGRHEDVEGSE